MSARRLVFEAPQTSDNPPSTLYAYLWPDDGMVQAVRRTTVDDRVDVCIMVRIYGQCSFSVDVVADELDDALTDAEQRMRALCPTAWAFYARHALVGAENPSTVEVVA